MNEVKLKGELNPSQVIFLSAGAMIGSSVFALTGLTAQITGPSAILAWVVAAILMLIVAINVAELATAFPKVGGIAQYPLETLSRRNRAIRLFLGYIAGWTHSWTQLLGTAFSALVLYQYLNISLVPWGMVLSIVVLTLVYVINIFGIRPTAKITLIITITLAVVLFIYFFSGVTKVKMVNFTPFFSGGAFPFLAVIPLTSLGYGGWTIITSLASEIKEPKKNIPKTISLSLLITGIVYLFVLFVTLGSVSPQSWTPDNQFAIFGALSFAATHFAENYMWVNIVVVIAAILALLSTVTALFAGTSRLFLALAENGMFPKGLAKINPKTRTPINAITMVYVLCLVFNIFFPTRLRDIIVFGSIYFAISFLITLIAQIGLKVSRKDITPPFRVPGGITLPVIGIIALILLGWTSFATELSVWGAGAFYIISGIGIVWFLILLIFKKGAFAKDSTVSRSWSKEDGSPIDE